ncbi:MAG: hypothetical protein KAQ85_00390 [Thermodesulfovibrionia bacterium]|nr:hypothetical protein [Thermodesulfovibrionia bacterium]
MTNKEDNRPAKGGKNRVVIQQVYIGFLGIKCCGQPVCVECEPESSPSCGWEEVYTQMGVRL